MPKVKVILPYIEKLAKRIGSIDGATSVLLWGSVAKNMSNPSFAARDIDLIVVSDIFSEDLLSITEDDCVSPFNLSAQELASEGFEPKAVQFTKEFVKINEYNIDHWVISEDKKLMHWGAVAESKDDYEDLQRDAEHYAETITNMSRKEINSKTEIVKSNWAFNYNKFFKKFSSDAPSGWFESKCLINEVLTETHKLY